MAPKSRKRKKTPSRDLRTGSFEVRLPASTSNLGAGFDCFGLALQLYLTIRATIIPSSPLSCRVQTRGSKENATLPRTDDNLIYRSMAYAASREGVLLPPVHLAVRNEIPVSRGLGGSAAAIVGGIKLCGLICDRQIPDDEILDYATELEGHPDNIAAALLGGFVVTCTNQQGNVIALKRAWPSDLKIVVVSPDSQVETKLARAALPRGAKHADAVYNLQRAALFNAALGEQRYDLLWEAMKDRLHQPWRQSLVPGLAEALALAKTPGLLGLALSGAGPSVVAVANDNFKDIGKAIANCFRRYGIKATIRRLDIDDKGCRTSAPRRHTKAQRSSRRQSRL